MLDDAVRFFDLLSIDYLIDKVTLICNEQLLLDIGICCTTKWAQHKYSSKWKIQPVSSFMNCPNLIQKT